MCEGAEGVVPYLWRACQDHQHRELDQQVSRSHSCLASTTSGLLHQGP